MQNNLLKHKFFIVLNLVFYYCFAQTSTYHVHSLISTESGRQQIAFFLDNVLRQQSSHQIMPILDTIVQENKQPLDDITFYALFSEKIKRHRSFLDIVSVVKLLRYQKNLLHGQIGQMISHDVQMGDCLEIGTPGTYVSTLKDQIQGTMYVVTDQVGVTDIVQASSYNPLKKFKAYDKQLALNNYDPIGDEIKDNSLDLVICMIGLHHSPQEKLDSFVASIYRILKPGGIFILRDHDAYNDNLYSAAYVAHFLYNAIIPAETVQAEQSEIRNFKSVQYWKHKLSQHGFTATDKDLLQDGDSTLNTLMKFEKPYDVHQGIASFTQDAQRLKSYARDPAQTFLTIPEWFNVEVSQEYAKFIEHTPFYEFPYMKYVALYWKLFWNSWKCAAESKGGHLKLLASPSLMSNYVAMNLFIGTSMTIEHSAKALVSLPMRLIFSGSETGSLCVMIHDPENSIANCVQVQIEKEYPDNYKLIKVPRYKKFVELLQQLAEYKNLQIIKIANNDYIVCKIRYKESQSINLHDIVDLQFTWNLPTAPGYVYAEYKVAVKSLLGFVQKIKKQDLELLYIHDF